MSIEQFNEQRWCSTTQVLYRDVRHMQGEWGTVTGVDFSGGIVWVRTARRLVVVSFGHIMEVRG